MRNRGLDLGGNRALFLLGTLRYVGKFQSIAAGGQALWEFDSCKPRGIHCCLEESPDSHRLFLLCLSVSFTVDQAPGTSLDLSWALWGMHKITQAGSLPLRLSRVCGMRRPAGGVLQQAATLSPPGPWLPDLLVDSDGQAANAPCPWEE